MKIGIVGTRTYNNYEQFKIELEQFLQTSENEPIHITQIISGGATGADKLAKTYAKEYADANNLDFDIFYKEFLPDWKKFGRSAGAIRNRDIIKNSDKLIAFWDGISSGTLITINIATELKKQIKIIYY